MGIPSYRAEGHGHNRRITVTFYGKVPPDHFSVMGVEYEAMTKCRMVARVQEDGRTMLACSRCGHVWRRSLAPSVGEHCRCGARVVA